MATGGRDVFSPQQGLSFLEDAEPRPPPRIPRLPMTFDIEKPKMVVPDVSLIFNSSSGPNTYVNASSTIPKGSNGNINSATSSKSPVSTEDQRQPNDSLVGLNYNELQQELRSLVPLVSSHGAMIVKMEEKLDKIIEFQEKFLSQLFQKGAAVSKEVQTEGYANLTPPSAANSRDTKKSSPEMMSRQPRKSSSPSIPPPNRVFENSYRPGQAVQKQKLKGPIGRLKYTDKNDEDLSAILKDIQLPNMDEPSVFSDASGLKSLELQEFNDESFQSGSGIDSPLVGASASNFGSSPSSDDESEGTGGKPTVTFYNNVLGNVNRLLERGNTNKYGKHGGNDPSSAKTVEQYNQRTDRRGGDLQNGGSSDNSSNSSGNRNSPRNPIQNENVEPGDAVVEATKRYLEKLGVQFGSPTPAEKKINVGNNSKNYMIQQNVYNSIYIPTVNCPPVIETFDSTGESGHFQTLAQKYVSPQELQQFDALKANNDANNGTRTETTVYGMSPNNLSFATKQYLQRYGLVHDNEKGPGLARKQPSPLSNQSPHFVENMDSRNDRILDITAIRNQPKLL